MVGVSAATGAAQKEPEMDEYSYPDTDQLAAALRRMLKCATLADGRAARFDVESVARFRTRDGEFANILYYSQDEYDTIIEWLTDPARHTFAYAGETKTRVGVAYVREEG